MSVKVIWGSDGQEAVFVVSALLLHREKTQLPSKLLGRTAPSLSSHAVA